MKKISDKEKKILKQAQKILKKYIGYQSLSMETLLDS